ncbi:unnamed protein product [Durusdinium trenchii]|uniref:Uncharacterized protein n=1 Tax=Durusdinium trenchii TaxID=1381693 RepID=A0ABP0RLX6_9DINO
MRMPMLDAGDLLRELEYEKRFESIHSFAPELSPKTRELAELKAVRNTQVGATQTARIAQLYKDHHRRHSVHKNVSVKAEDVDGSNKSKALESSQKLFEDAQKRAERLQQKCEAVLQKELEAFQKDCIHKAVASPPEFGERLHQEAKKRGVRLQRKRKEVLWSQPPDDYLARGVLVCEEGEWKVHTEVLDSNNSAVPLEEWQSTAIAWALAKEFANTSVIPGCGGASDPRRHVTRRGKSRPAVHCQADSITSVAADIRDGHFIDRLFQSLYVVSPRRWTLRGINVGAGIDYYPVCLGEDTYCNQDDPLDLWLRSEAMQALFVDADSYRLQQAMKKVTAQRSNVEDLELVTLDRALSPVDVEAGLLDELLLDIYEGQVDIIKIDIDSYDCALLRALLEKVRSYVLVLESQPLIPPPYKFARAYNPKDPLEQGLIGCSLSYQLRMLEPEYMLLIYSEHDTVFVHKDLAADLETLPPGRLFPWTRYPLRFPVDEHDAGTSMSMPVHFGELGRVWSSHLGQ